MATLGTMTVVFDTEPIDEAFRRIEALLDERTPKQVPVGELLAVAAAASASTRKFSRRRLFGLKG